MIYNKSCFIENAHSVYDSVTDPIWLKRANCDKDVLDWKSAFDLIEKMNRA
jgi:hypothetical protein